MKSYSLRRLLPMTMKTLLFSFFFSIVFLKADAQAGNALQYTNVGTSGGFPNQQFLTLSNNIVQSISGSYTIEAWVRWNGVDDVWERVFDFGNSTSSTMFFTPSGQFIHVARFGFILNSTVEVVDAAIAFPKNVWTHLAITVDAATSTGKIYFDGVLQGSSAPGAITLRPSMMGATTNNWLGKSEFLQDPTFNGVIDELRISNTVRYTSNFTPQKSEFTTDANTVALFHFNEGTGQTTADASANGFVGILGILAVPEPDLDPTWFTNSILPVRMEYFTAQKLGTAVDLKWKANSTGDGGEFIIERSQEGTQFKSIGKLAINSDPGSFIYTFRDVTALPGKNFYRIRILEPNASPLLSSTVWVDMNSKATYDIYPTIGSTELFVTVPGTTDISIYNAGGVLVKKLQLQASQQIDISGLAKGLYHVRFEGTTTTSKFIKM